MIRAIAPTTYHRGWGSLASAGRPIAALGSRPLVVHGAAGRTRIATPLHASLTEADVDPTYLRHDGPVTNQALDAVSQAVQDGLHDLVIGVGGGRVLDLAKGAAHRACIPCVTLPTSPATCAAVTALTVLYDSNGAWRGSSMAPTCPALVVVDTEVLAGTPDRLLAAGVLDALAKVEEVRIAADVAGLTRSRVDPWVDAALASCTTLTTWVDPTSDALSEGLPSAADTRAALAEAVVVLPGLIAGLAGEGNKLAAAHAVHNAMTQVAEPRGGTPVAMHGEGVGFGLLVQACLAGADDANLMRRIEWTRRIGVDVTLERLGWARYRDVPQTVLSWLAEAPAMVRTFPTADVRTLGSAIDRVDRLAVAAL